MRVTKINPRMNGIAGQFSYVAHVVEADNGYPFVVTFVGSVYGGPIFVGLTGGGMERIDSAVIERCGGVLTPEFIRNFYADED